MNNQALRSISLPATKELIGDGSVFPEIICGMLKTAKGFDNFEQSELMQLAQHMKAYRTPAGGTIVHEGNRDSALSVLIEGHISVYKEDSDDLVKQINSISPGKIFGEISVVDNLPYSASLVADTEVTILFMSSEDFHRCVNENPALGVRLLGLVSRLLCARLRRSSDQLVDYIDL